MSRDSPGRQMVAENNLLQSNTTANRDKAIWRRVGRALRCPARLMAHRRRTFLADQPKTAKARQVKGLDQVMVAVVGDRPGHRLAADRCRLEPPRAPAGVDVEALYRCRPHDRREVWRHVRQP